MPTPHVWQGSWVRTSYNRCESKTGALPTELYPYNWWTLRDFNPAPRLSLRLRQITDGVFPHGCCCDPIPRAAACTPVNSPGLAEGGAPDISRYIADPITTVTILPAYMLHCAGWWSSSDHIHTARGYPGLVFPEACFNPIVPILGSPSWAVQSFALQTT